MKNSLIEYEMFLLDKIPEFPEYHFQDSSKFTTEQVTASLIRYVIEDVLKWSPEDAYQSLDWKVLRTFKLEKIVRQHMQFLPGMNEKEECQYLVCKCYPNKFRFDLKKCILRIYDDILSGKKNKWNKKFFSDQEGMIRACICMQAAINRYLYGKGIKDLYAYFGDYQQGIHFINMTKLRKAYEKHCHLPIDFFHYSLPKNQRDIFLYNYYKFQHNYKIAQKKCATEITAGGEDNDTK